MSSLNGKWQALFLVALLSGCSDGESDGATSHGGNSAGAGAPNAGSPGAGNASGGASAKGGNDPGAGSDNNGGVSGKAGASGTSGSAGAGVGGATGATGGAGASAGGNAMGGNSGGGVGGAGTSGNGMGGAGAGGMGMAGAGGQLGNLFKDPFDAFDKNIWSCEYTCPTVSGGNANFHLLAGVAPNNEGSWSKIRYKPRRFTSGKFTVRFALTQRPKQAVWWGVALWDDGPNADGSEFNEINFGYTTSQSFTNAQFFFESAKHGKDVGVKIDVGVDLYDGSFHTGTLEYDATHVSFSFDGKLLETITDTSVIPTDPMDFIIGPRLVTGSSALGQDFSELADSTQIEW